MLDLAELQQRIAPLFPGLMGLQLRAVAEERVLAELLVRPDLCTTGGILHGGAVMAFADTLGAIGTVLNLPPASARPPPTRAPSSSRRPRSTPWSAARAWPCTAAARRWCGRPRSATPKAACVRWSRRPSWCSTALDAWRPGRHWRPREHTTRPRACPSRLTPRAVPIAAGSVAPAHLRALRRWPHWLQVSEQRVTLVARSDERDAALATMNHALRADGLIVAWRDEPFPLFDVNGGALGVAIERAATRFWGTLTLGAHCNGYVADAARPSGAAVDRTPLADQGHRPEPARQPDRRRRAGRPVAARHGGPRGLGRGRPRRPSRCNACSAAACCALLRDIPEGLQREWIHVYDLALPAGRDAAQPGRRGRRAGAASTAAARWRWPPASEMTVDAVAGDAGLRAAPPACSTATAAERPRSAHGRAGTLMTATRHLTAPTSARYDPVAIAAHWLLALLIVANLSLGLYMHDLPMSPQRLKLFNWHKWAGITILALSALRLAWRLGHPPPPDVPMPAWQRTRCAHRAPADVCAVLRGAAGRLGLQLGGGLSGGVVRRAAAARLGRRSTARWAEALKATAPRAGAGTGARWCCCTWRRR